MEDIELKRHPETGELIAEEWVGVPGFADSYEVSNYGRVRSYKPINGRGENKKQPHLLKPLLTHNGYHRISLRRDNAPHTFPIHRIVATAFICERPSDNMEINHKDGCKTNNMPHNIEWVTSSQNQKHAFRHGLQVSQKGEDHGHAKLSKEDILNIRRRAKNEYQCDISDEYGVSRALISLIINRKRWKHL